MELIIDKEEITGLILKELRAIAFGEGVKINHKLAAIRVLVKFLSLEKTPEEEKGVVIINDMGKPARSPEKDAEEPPGDVNTPPLNREQRRRLQKRLKREKRREAESPASGSPPP